MILLSDANILIDLGYVDGLDIIAKLGFQVEVLDIVLEECDSHKQPNLKSDIQNSGIHIINTDIQWITQSKVYQTGPLSEVDSVNLFYAKQFNRCLLTNDGPLRKQCSTEKVVVHGTLWIINECWDKNLKSPPELCKWLDDLLNFSRRLPRQEIDKLKIKLNCK